MVCGFGLFLVCGLLFAVAPPIWDLRWDPHWDPLMDSSSLVSLAHSSPVRREGAEGVYASTGGSRCESQKRRRVRVACISDVDCNDMNIASPLNTHK